MEAASFQYEMITIHYILGRVRVLTQIQPWSDNPLEVKSRLNPGLELSCDQTVLYYMCECPQPWITSIQTVTRTDSTTHIHWWIGTLFGTDSEYI